MDIIYFCKETPNNNIELKYSLQFINNVKHRNLYLIGNLPSYIKTENVIHIPYDDINSFLVNVTDKHKMMVEIEWLSEEFLWMYDDLFILGEMDKKDFVFYQKDTIKEYLDQIEKKSGRNRYWKGLKKVDNIFPNWFCYEYHQPRLFRTKRIKEIVNKYPDCLSITSLYGNSYPIEVEDLPEGKDFKIYEPKDFNKELLDRPFLSTLDSLSYYDKLWNSLEEMLESMPEELRYRYVKKDG